MKKDNPVKTSLTFEERQETIRSPSKYYYMNGLGQYVYLKGGDRLKLQQWLDSEYGKGHYMVRCEG